MVRFKCRYLLVEVRWGTRVPPSLTSTDLFKTLRAAILEQLGELGAAHITSSLQIKYWNGVTGVAIVRVARDFATPLRQCIERVREIARGSAAALHVLHAAGSMKLCQKAAVRLLTSAEAIDALA
jgi:ribonuclease P/MRP protein subunit POP5